MVLSARRTSQDEGRDTPSTRCTSPTVFCRICLGHKEPLLTPCKCAGSHGHVHNDCLRQWNATKKSSGLTCEICNTNYHYSVQNPRCCSQFPKDRWKKASRIEKISIVGIFILVATGIATFTVGQYMDEGDNYLFAVILIVFGIGLFLPGLCLLVAVLVVLLRTDLPNWRLEKGFIQFLNRPREPQQASSMQAWTVPTPPPRSEESDVP